VTPFERQGAELVARFEQAEVDVLVQLASEVQGLLSQFESVQPDSASERAIGRLLPAAYRDGGDNDEEFRRFTAEGLIDRKTRNAARLRATLADGDSAAGVLTVTLDADGVQSWLRTLTDIRLTLAAGLGIENEGDERLIDDESRFALDVYAWLGYVQETLLEALES
jgi:hypothetical protein